jgi:hypothetical protein
MLRVLVPHPWRNVFRREGSGDRRLRWRAVGLGVSHVWGRGRGSVSGRRRVRSHKVARVDVLALPVRVRRPLPLILVRELVVWRWRFSRVQPSACLCRRLCIFAAEIVVVIVIRALVSRGRRRAAYGRVHRKATGYPHRRRMRSKRHVHRQVLVGGLRARVRAHILRKHMSMTAALAEDLLEPVANWASHLHCMHCHWVQLLLRSTEKRMLLRVRGHRHRHLLCRSQCVNLRWRLLHVAS